MSSSQCLAIGFNESHIGLLTTTSAYLKQITNNIITSVDYDQENSVFITGSQNQTISITSILNKNMTIFYTNHSINFILSLNMTHFLISDNSNNFVIYDLKNRTFYPIFKPAEFTNYGPTSFIRLLKGDKLVLIGTVDKKILVYDLQTNNFKVNFMSSVVKSLDFLNRSFIVCQCSSESICVYKLELDNSLTQLLVGKFNASIDIFSIKIVNDSLILFGMEIINHHPLCFWDLQNGTLKYFETENKILCIETLGIDLVIFGQLNQYLNVINTTSLILNKVLTPVSVYGMKFIEKCDSVILDNYLVREIIPWSFLNNNNIENFLNFNTTKLKITNNNFVSTSILLNTTERQDSTNMNIIQTSKPPFDPDNSMKNVESTLETNTFTDKSNEKKITDNALLTTLITTKTTEKQDSTNMNIIQTSIINVFLSTFKSSHETLSISTKGIFF
ncbi:unnamed protein product [Brachionus calyciflorus]|uniref:Uncharacterized protein n=1 Tax=Brachionus calyciflorus TaxID=104777 RepID=A0A814GY24_9BILA|nr:unnamed protein product [Brachionus calyciflorus]